MKYVSFSPVLPASNWNDYPAKPKFASWQKFLNWKQLPVQPDVRNSQIAMLGEFGWETIV